MSKSARKFYRKPTLEILEDRTLLSAASSNVIDLSGLQVSTNSYDSSNILVEFQNMVNAPHSLLAGTTIGTQLGLVGGLYEVNLSSGVSVAEAIAAYQANPAVVSAEPDYTMVAEGTTAPNTSSFNQQWALHNTGQDGGVAGDDIGAEQAWSVTTGSSQVVVAEMDTGVDYDHPDLYDNIWINQAEIPLTRMKNLADVYHDGGITFADLNNPINQGQFKITDVNGDGVIDAADILAPMTVNSKGQDTGWGGWAYAGNTQDGDTAHPNDFIGWNFVNNTNNPFDDNGHGTNVAGIIGGTGNDGGTYGVAQQVSIMPVKFLNSSGQGTISEFIAGLEYSIQHGAKISNNSWSGANNSTILLDAIENAQNAGQIFVAAAGNGGVNTDVNPTYPSSFNLNNIISVAASTSSDQLASFSNYGAKTVTLAAPGQDIYSTIPNGQYQSWSGTSMAAPMVTGALVLVWSIHPTWTYTQVINQVLSTVTAEPAFKGITTTGGVLDVARAVGYQPPPVVTPQVLSALATGTQYNTLNNVEINFNVAINPATFLSSTVTLTGPNGKAISVTITPMANSGDRIFNIAFATQTLSGNYLFALSSAIKDDNGDPLKAYTATFAIAPIDSFSSTKSVPITANTKIISTITITQDITIANLQVLLNITSTNDSALYIHLTSPSGLDILLSNRRGGSGQNYTNTLFSDGASTSIVSGTAPFTGTFRPEGYLADFTGADAKGTWTLWVEDRASNNSGTIVNWSLNIVGPLSSTLKTQSYDGPLVETVNATAPVAARSTSDVWEELNDASARWTVSTSDVGAYRAQPNQQLVDRSFAAPGVVADSRMTAWLSRMFGTVDDTEDGVDSDGDAADSDLLA